MRIDHMFYSDYKPDEQHPLNEADRSDVECAQEEASWQDSTE